jgi:hypothetical protein
VPRAHVSVIEDQQTPKEKAPEVHAPEPPPELADENRPRGFHVHAVPIDQPFDRPAS